MEVRCAAADSELVADRLLGLGASAVAESPSAGDTGPTDSVVLTADLEAERLEEFSWPDTEVNIIDPGTGWLDTWRDHAAVQHAGRFVVRPAWMPAGEDEGDVSVSAGADDRIELVVDPGHTFGSGTHETTRLCLELLGRWVQTGDSVLDLGCGSGILSVAALLVGASRATGVDIDPGSQAVSQAVASANGVADRYRFAGATAPTGQFDVVVVNMLVNEVESLAPVIAGAVGSGGLVIASGFLAEQVTRAQTAVGDRSNSQIVESVAGGEWRGLALRVAP